MKRRLELFCIAYPIATGCEILYPIMSPSTLYYIEKGETLPVIDNIFDTNGTKQYTYPICLYQIYRGIRKKYGQECYAHKKRYRTVAFIPDKSYL